MGKILVKQAGAVQQFQNVGAGGKPGIKQLWNRMRDPTAGGWQKINAGLGLAGKAGAIAGTAITTANQLQGGNITAPLGMGYTYAGLDPTGGMIGESGNVTPAEQQAAIRAKDLEASKQQGLQNLTTVGLDASQLASGEQQPNQQQMGDLAALQANQVDPRQAQLDAARTAQAAQQPNQITNVATTPLGNQQTQPAQPVQQPQPVQPAQPVAAPGQVPPTQMGGILPGMGQPNAAPAAPVPAAPAPAGIQQTWNPDGSGINQPVAPTPAAPAPVAQPTTPEGGLLNRINNQQLPAPERHVGVTSGTANAGNQRGLLGKVKSDERFQQVSQAKRDEDARFQQTSNSIKNLNLPPAQQPEVAELVPEPTQAPQPTTRDNRAAMNEKIERLGQDPEIAANVARMKNNRVPVKQPMQTPPPLPPQVYKNPNEILGGSGELTPAPKRVGVEPDRTQAFTNLGPTKHTINNDYSYGGQPPMSGRDLLQGTGIAKPVDQGSREFQEMLDNEVSWQDNAPAQYQQQNPIDAAMASLKTNPDRLGRGESKELGQGATITNTMGRGTERGLSPVSSGSDEAYNRAKELMAAQDKLNYSKNPFNKPFFDESRKAFVDMVFNEFGDLFHKADPHEVGSIVMGLYLDRVTG